MRRVEKGAAPQCLDDLRATPGADWSSVFTDQKQELREAAFVEQSGLCAYCMSRLPAPTDQAMRIEHWASRASQPDLCFVWSNLLGVCKGDLGVENQSRRERLYCDNFRGSAELFVHPAEFPPDAGALFSYTQEGEIRAAPDLPSPLKTKVSTTVEHLNLNIDRLKRNRASVLRVQREALKKGFSRNSILGLLEVARGVGADGRRMEYCQVAIHYLEKKLRQTS